MQESPQLTGKEREAEVACGFFKRQRHVGRKRVELVKMTDDGVVNGDVTLWLCKRGKLGSEGSRFRWEAVMFLFNVVNLNVWLFIFDIFAKCFVEVVVIMFGLDEGRFCWGCFACYVFMLMFNVSSFPLMFFQVGVLGLFFLKCSSFPVSLFVFFVCSLLGCYVFV